MRRLEVTPFCDANCSQIGRKFHLMKSVVKWHFRVEIGIEFLTFTLKFRKIPYTKCLYKEGDREGVELFTKVCQFIELSKFQTLVRNSNMISTKNAISSQTPSTCRETNFRVSTFRNF